MHVFIFHRDLTNKDVSDQEIKGLGIFHPFIQEKNEAIKELVSSEIAKCKRERTSHPEKRRFVFEIYSLIVKRFLIEYVENIETLRLNFVIDEKNSLTPNERKAHLANKVSSIIKSMTLRDTEYRDKLKFKLYFDPKK